MLREAFGMAARIPGVKRVIIRALYQRITDLDHGSDVLFMNYGYASLVPGAIEPALQAEDERDRLCIHLYQQVLGATDLAGKTVLEVGSGRGGGASYLTRYHHPAAYTGLDFSDKAIAFCQARHTAPGLAFRHGDAEAMPFADASVDAVINVESSHNYPSMDRFLAEVVRVLRPGGVFLFTDHRDLDAVAPLRAQLTRAGLTLRDEVDITANVVAALDQDDARKRALIARRAPRWARHGIGEFAALVGTDAYEEFRSRRSLYLRFVCGKAP